MDSAPCEMSTHLRPILVSDNVRSVQLHASRREDHFSQVRLAVFVQGTTYGHNSLCRQWYECGMPQRGHWF